MTEIETTIRTIVAGYDDSETSGRALERAGELARALGARLVVVSVGPREGALELIPESMEPLMMVPAGAGGAIPPSAIPAPAEGTSATGQNDPAELMLERARFLLRQRGLDAEFAKGSGDPADELLRVAHERDADLIVVGTHEGGFLDRLLRGDVSSAVTRRADRDVLLVR
jgi:nucleotide-binding universal stress UspA family protein